jgi:CIC family chloride channel protein
LNFNDIKDYIFDPILKNTIIVEEIMQTNFTVLTLNENLIDIQKKFERSNSWSLPVVEDGKFLGLISKATMLDLYRKELKAQTEQ